MGTANQNVMKISVLLPILEFLSLEMLLEVDSVGRQGSGLGRSKKGREPMETPETSQSVPAQRDDSVDRHGSSSSHYQRDKQPTGTFETYQSLSDCAKRDRQELIREIDRLGKEEEAIDGEMRKYVEQVSSEGNYINLKKKKARLQWMINRKKEKRTWLADWIQTHETPEIHDEFPDIPKESP